MGCGIDVRGTWLLLVAAIVASAINVQASARNVQDVIAGATERLQSQDYYAAAAMLQTAVSRWPDRADLWNLLGIARSELHQDAQARAAFEHGLQIAPRAVALYENLGLLFYRKRNYRGAKKALAQAVALGSEKSSVRFSLASSLLRTGDASRALEELKQLEPEYGKLAAYWDERGRAELLTDPVAAEQSFSRALALRPGDLAALNGAAAAAERRHQDEEALSYLIKAREAHPNDVRTLAHFGSVCIRRDLGVDAVDALKKAHQLDPSSSSILFLLARANVSLSNWQTAYNLFHTYSERVPNYAPTYFAMGWIDTKLNRLDDARRLLRHALALDPKLEDARYTLAQVELDDGDLDRAHRLLAEVLRADPHHAKANLAMGDVFFRQGKLSDAERYLKNAVRDDPDLAAAHYKLSLLYFRRHNTKQADAERVIAARLNAKTKKASRTQLKLVLPEMPSEPR